MPCPECGGPVFLARRHEPGRRRPVRVTICWRCGWESPAFYDRTRTERDGGPILEVRTCAGCGVAFARTNRRSVGRYCGYGCSGPAALVFARRALGRAS